MTLAQLIASRALWRSRELFRARKHDFYHRRSKRPRAERDRLARKWHKLWEEARTERRRRDRQIRARKAAWGGSRAVTEEVIGIVKRHSPHIAVTSRKRDETFGNPDSDHHTSQKTADAVDFATDSNYDLAKHVAKKLGGIWTGDYDAFVISRNGKLYRVQIIAGTHGTGPHLHVGVRRV